MDLAARRSTWMLHGLLTNQHQEPAPACCGSSAPASGRSSRQVSPKSKGWLAEVLTTLAAFVMFLGPGISNSFYVVMVGYYEYRFGTKVFFILMLLAVYSPFPVVTLLQANFDAYFDRALSTSSTYSARIGFGLVVQQAVAVVWMFSPPTETVVICIGFAMGSVGAVVTASSHQVISAIDPTKLIFCELGGQFGSVIPLVVFSLYGFTPASEAADYRRMIAVVIVVNFLAMITLAALHSVDLFNKAFARLALDLEAEEEEDPIEAAAQALHLHVSKGSNETKLLDEPMDCSYAAFARGTTPQSVEQPPPSSPSSPSPGRNIPTFVYRWQVTKGLMSMIVAFIVSMASFYGDPVQTQLLASIKLASDFLGRLCALPLIRSEQFRSGPWLRFAATGLVTRVILFALLVVQLGTPFLPRPVFLVVWCSFALLDRMMSTFSDVTCGAFVEVQDRKYVSRLTLFCGFGGLLLGLGIALAVSVPMINHKKSSGPKIEAVAQAVAQAPDLLQLAAGSDLDTVRHAVRSARAAVLQFALQPS